MLCSCTGQKEINANCKTARGVEGVGWMRENVCLVGCGLLSDGGGGGRDWCSLKGLLDSSTEFCASLSISPSAPWSNWKGEWRAKKRARTPWQIVSHGLYSRFKWC